MNKQQLQQLLENSINAALKAGKEITKIYKTNDFDVEMKSDNSPLTKADKASHRIITNYLNHNMTIHQSIDPQIHQSINPPIHQSINAQIPLLSEEGKNIPYKERKDWELYWLIDPLDGTKEFIKRNGEFTVNIALIEKNEPILGVIYAPEYEAKIKDKSKKDKVVIPDPARPDGSAIGNPESIQNQVHNNSEVLNSLIRQFTKSENFVGSLYFAAKDFGAFKANFINDELHLLKLDSNSKLSNLPASGVVQNSTLVAVGSRSHSSEEEKTKLEELGVKEIISVGSSLKFCMVAEGNAQVYYRQGPTMEWDVAAGYSIAKEAGAKIEGLQFNKENLLNSSFLVSL